MTSYFLLPTSYFLLPTSFLLLTTYYLLLTTYYFLLTAACSRWGFVRVIPLHYFLLLNYYYFLLPTSYSLLPTSYFLLTAACSRWGFVRVIPGYFPSGLLILTNSSTFYQFRVKLSDMDPLLVVSNNSYYSLLTTHHLLLTTHYSLLTTHYSLLTTQHSLLTTHHSLLTTHYYSLLTTHYYSLLTTDYSPLTSYYLLLRWPLTTLLASRRQVGRCRASNSTRTMSRRTRADRGRALVPSISSSAEERSLMRFPSPRGSSGSHTAVTTSTCTWWTIRAITGSITLLLSSST